jgi:hypothetical protein
MILVAMLTMMDATAAHAEERVADGDVRVTADVERESGTITVAGEAAHALFDLIAFRTRIITVSDVLRRAQGVGAACFEQFNADPVMEPVTYSCVMRVGEYAAISAPAP